MAQKNVLGKGFGAIFPDLIDDFDKKKPALSCGIEELSPNRYQPRKNFNDDDQKKLIASVKQSGIIQPIIVRKKADAGYEIIAGERRWRAAQAVGLKEVPIVIREATDVESATISLIENILREDLNPLEEANAYVTLIETFNLSQEEVSSRTGKDRSTVANTIRLLKLPAKIKEALITRKISAGHARCLLACNTVEEQIAALNLILKKDLNVRETERLIQKAKVITKNKKQNIQKTAFLTILKSIGGKIYGKSSNQGFGKQGFYRNTLYIHGRVKPAVRCNP